MKDILAYLFFKMICIKDRRQYLFVLLKLKLGTKEGTANERTHLRVFIKFIRKN